MILFCPAAPPVMQERAAPSPPQPPKQPNKMVACETLPPRLRPSLGAAEDLSAQAQRRPPSRCQALPHLRVRRRLPAAPPQVQLAALRLRRSAPQVPPPPVLYLSTPRTARISGRLTPLASLRSFRRLQRRPLWLKAQLTGGSSISLKARYGLEHVSFSIGPRLWTLGGGGRAGGLLPSQPCGRILLF